MSAAAEIINPFRIISSLQTWWPLVCISLIPTFVSCVEKCIVTSLQAYKRVVKACYETRWECVEIRKSLEHRKLTLTARAEHHAQASRSRTHPTH
jgi:hypothetical protein